MVGLTLRPSAPGERYAAIADHGVIGDLRTAALVALDGTLDFLCLPEFDSPTVFAGLLDAERGGTFAIAFAEGGASGEQRYVRDTNVLVTRFVAPNGEVELVDFMPVERAPSATRVVRMVRAVRGTARMRMRCVPRFDYGRVAPVAELGPTGAVFTGPGGLLRLTSSVSLTLIDGGAEAVFDLEPRRGACFVLEHAHGRVSGRAAALDARWAARALRRTVVFWRRWVAQARYDGPWRPIVRRSALVLKLLQSRGSGAIVAAPTFGLPEQIGGARNWDFRYAWIRDASFIAYAFVRLGMHDASNAFTRWAVARCEDAGRPGELQSFYGIDGRRALTEETLDHLDGHRGSRPVRIGNAAFDQLQLDIYGELIDALYLRDQHNEPTSRALWGHIAELTDWVCRHWQRTDQGIWEVRGDGQEFLYSRVMCWVAVDRALRLAGRRRFAAPREAWRATRDAIRGDVLGNFWNAEIGAFVGSKGSASVDAACLVMPLVGFIPVSDQRWRSTLRVVETRLVRDGLVRRYDMTGMDTDAGSLTAPAFTVCSFWYAECLARCGEMEKARETMRRLLGRANHLGLFSEDLSADGSQLGNFPLGLTHAALIGAAFAIGRS
ncbi:MAG TPA: glycoside hydrolase family 15 protein [Gemmatimonadaceae bacterium]|nr:glycoside hydrolase family 15 protein [Gemmatimonadaceae bacterium]